MSEFKNQILTAIPSPDDPRDYSVASLVVAEIKSYPKNFCLPYDGIVIKNQGSIGQCVAESIYGYCREIVEQKQSGKYKRFSIGFGYANRLPTDHQGSGMIPRQALERVLKDGAVLYNDFKYEAEYPEIRKNFDYQKLLLLAKAAPYKISAYARARTNEDIKDALMKLGPVTVMYPIYESFYMTKSNGIVLNPNRAVEKLYGYHEMTIIGWRDDNTWVVLNSWGEDFGNKGTCYIPMAFRFNEAWTITDKILPKKII